MSGKKSLRKGKVGEYNARKYLEKLGYEVTNQSEDPKKPDLRVIENISSQAYQKIEDWEIKYRESVSKIIYQWLEEKNADAVMVKRVKKGEGKYPWLIIRKLK